MTNKNSTIIPTNTEQLIVYIVTKLSGNILRTTLLKFLYLVDLEYIRSYYRQFSDLKYIYYKNGPWDQRFYDILNKLKNFEIQEVKHKKFNKDEEYALYYKGSKPRFTPKLPEEVIIIIEKILFIFKKPNSQKSKVLKDVLDHVYKDTKPMKYATKNKPVDFSLEFMTPEEKKYVDVLNREYLTSDTPKLLKKYAKAPEKKTIYNFLKKKVSLSEELLLDREETDEESLLF